MGGNHNGHVEKAKPRRRKPDPRPEGFQDMENLVKDIFAGQDESYMAWLHAQHQEKVLKFNLANRAEIAEIAREGD